MPSIGSLVSVFDAAGGCNSNQNSKAWGESESGKRAVFDFLGHPSCLYVTDPEFRAIDLIGDLVRKAGDRAALVDLGTIAQRAKRRQEKVKP